MTSNDPPEYRPTWRKPAGMLAILAIIALWAAAILALADQVARLPDWLELVFYAVAGIIWIAPLKPLLAWMETGRFRPPGNS